MSLQLPWETAGPNGRKRRKPLACERHAVIPVELRAIISAGVTVGVTLELKKGSSSIRLTVTGTSLA